MGYDLVIIVTPVDAEKRSLEAFLMGALGYFMVASNENVACGC